MDKASANKSFVNTAFLGSRKGSDSPQVLTILKALLIIFILISGDLLGCLPMEVPVT